MSITPCLRSQFRSENTFIKPFCAQRIRNIIHSIQFFVQQYPQPSLSSSSFRWRGNQTACRPHIEFPQCRSRPGTTTYRDWALLYNRLFRRLIKHDCFFNISAFGCVCDMDVIDFVFCQDGWLVGSSTR